eukprot:763677-Hanusia_phi.AAC.4
MGDLTRLSRGELDALVVQGDGVLMGSGGGVGGEGAVRLGILVKVGGDGHLHCVERLKEQEAMAKEEKVVGRYAVSEGLGTEGRDIQNQTLTPLPGYTYPYLPLVVLGNDPVVSKVHEKPPLLTGPFATDAVLLLSRPQL